jgi:salicylate hydroxylase
MRTRYGESYATLHRADLHALLLQAVRQLPRVHLALDARVAGYAETADGVRVTAENEDVREARALIGADGLWSRVRSQLLGAQPVRASGHLAYRGMVCSADLPAALRAPLVTAWLGPRLHVVHYPVRQGEWFNVVVVVHGVLGQGHGGAVGADPQSWTHEAHAEDLRRSLGAAHADLLQMVDAVPRWTLWPLNDRPPMTGPQDHARGRVALLGDAAHPLRPYLAQGAAMALEDAWTLGCLVEQQPAGAEIPWATLFERFAQVRWARNARVQRRSQRNGSIFHASGLVRWGRDTAMAALGEPLLDLPWLYGGPPQP